MVSRIETRDRATDWARKGGAQADLASLRYWTAPTELMPTDGIVRQTAREVTQGAKSEIGRAHV